MPHSHRSRGGRRATVVLAALSLGLVLAACGSGGSSARSTAASTAASTVASTVAPTAAPATAPPGAVDPNAPEVVEPGDIPDDQVFVPYQSADGTFSVKVPEGWARTEAADGTVTFTDKYNSITIGSGAVSTPATVESVTATGLADVASDPTFVLVDVTAVTRSAGDGVLARYEIGSAPNSVTGNQALLAVERYVFDHQGTEVTLTLSGAKGADNVDPWKIVSDSLTWM